MTIIIDCFRTAVNIRKRLCEKFFRKKAKSGRFGQPLAEQDDAGDRGPDAPEAVHIAQATPGGSFLSAADRKIPRGTSVCSFPGGSHFLRNAFGVKLV